MAKVFLAVNDEPYEGTTIYRAYLDERKAVRLVERCIKHVRVRPELQHGEEWSEEFDRRLTAWMAKHPAVKLGAWMYHEDFCVVECTLVK